MSGWLKRWRLALSAVLFGLPVTIAASADRNLPNEQIVTENSPSVVYVEIDNAQGEMIDSGSGVMVSHNGWMITAAHLKPDSDQVAWGVIGERGGQKFKLESRDVDQDDDVALWQFPQSNLCHQTATLTDEHVHQLEPILALGSPESLGLTGTTAHISNLQGYHGFYKADGLLEGGNSGGPVFNQAGFVIATVQGGTLPGTGNNDLVPIGPAIALLRKHNVDFALNTPEPCSSEAEQTQQSQQQVAPCDNTLSDITIEHSDEGISLPQGGHACVNGVNIRHVIGTGVVIRSALNGSGDSSNIHKICHVFFNNQVKQSLDYPMGPQKGPIDCLDYTHHKGATQAMLGCQTENLIYYGPVFSANDNNQAIELPNPNCGW